MGNAKGWLEFSTRLVFLVAFLMGACNSANETGFSVENNNYFEHISKNDVRLDDPVAGEWRYSHKEASQNFDDYKKLNPKKALLNETKLYLLPLGNFSKSQARMLEITREYLQIFFQLETKLLEPVPDEIIPDSAKRTRGENRIQLFTPYILNNLLKGKIPGDGYALMAISEKDLYPHPDWNFVFGIASYADRIGISSISRLQNKDSSNLLFLRRLINTASHEIGHMFSLHHCNFSKCAMNGSNSLHESDSQTGRLCSECQKKLYWNIGYDNRKRLTELISYLERNNLKEDLSDLEMDYKGLK